MPGSVAVPVILDSDAGSRKESTSQLALSNFLIWMRGETTNVLERTMRLINVLISIFLLSIAAESRGQAQSIAERQKALLELNEEGVILAQAKRYQEAIAAIREAIRREPQYPELYKNLATAYINSGQPADALEPLGQALKLEPNRADFHFYLGVANSELGRHLEATKAYEAALRHGWNTADLYSNLGWSYYLSGKAEKALEPLRNAERLEPEDHKILNNLGVVYASLGDYEEAAQTLRKALQLKPDLTLTRFNLGWVYATMKNRRAALEQYNILQTQAPQLGRELYKEIYRDLLIELKK
jgi:Flp pilus assembly protein TadD